MDNITDEEVRCRRDEARLATGKRRWDRQAGRHIEGTSPPLESTTYSRTTNSQITREIFDIRMAMFDGATAFLPHPVTTPGVLPFWAFLERVERVPLAGGASRPGPRERRLSSVRNTVGAVASLSKVSTPLGRARAWIRQCLVSKCLEACVAALLDEERLVKVREIEREREAKRGGPDGFVYFAVVLVLFVRPAHRRVPWRGGCVLSRGLPQGQPPMSGCFVAAL